MNLNTVMGNPVRLTQISVVIGLIVLVILGWLLVLTPRWAATEDLQVRAGDLELGQLTLTRRERDLLALADELPQTAAQAQELFASMPQTADLPALLLQLTEAATDAGIPADRIEVINTGIPTSAAGEDQPDSARTDIELATMKVDMTVTGTTVQLDRFIMNMQELERSFVIQDVTIVAGGLEDERLESLTVAGTMFVLESPLPDLIAEAERITASGR
jgi:Tfp pilus assembly protein PilO